MGFFRKNKTNSGSTLAALGAAYQDIQCRIELAMTAPRKVAAGIASVMDAAAQSTKHLAKQGSDVLGMMSLSKVSATEQVRQFKEDRNILRGAQNPDIIVTVLILTLCVLIEGGLGAALFFASGKADLFLSIAYGLSVAGINVGAGAINGFVFGRGLGFMIDVREPKPREAFIRLGSWIGFLVMVAAMLFMGFSAARIQLTGSPVGILNFSEVGFMATFANYYGNLLIFLGCLGGLVAIREGWVGLSDPIIGYSKIWNQADAELRQSVQDIFNDINNAIEDIYGDIAEQCDDALDDLRDVVDFHRNGSAELKSSISGHNLAVGEAGEVARREFDEAHARLVRIKEHPIESAGFDASRYDALLIPIPNLPAPNDSEAEVIALTEARQRLDVAYHQGIAVLAQANAGFLAGLSGIDLTLDDEGDDDVCE